jgi:16S rRNA (cytosine967-C5)-methyltransferase
LTKSPWQFRPRGKQPEPLPAPPGFAARAAAASILADIAGQGMTLDECFDADAPNARVAELEPRDRALARSIVVTSFRRLGTARAALAKFMEKGLPRKAHALEWTLIAAATQILFLDVPDHAAVDLAVRAVKADPRAAGFAALVNAVLRNVAREADELRSPADPFVDTPGWLAARWRARYGEEAAAAIALAHRMEPTLDLTTRGNPADWAARLGGVVLPTGSVRLDTRAPIVELEGYADGEWWVQDAAASLPARLMRAQAGMRVADLCSAPGGKTAQLAAAGAQVTALDRSAGRQKRLAANLSRLGLSADVRVGDALTADLGVFDAVLLDAPCSATGTIRRHPDVAWNKFAGDIATLSTLQNKMIDRAVAMLKPGGTLVYCVCSMEPEEGDGRVAALLRRDPDIARDPIEAGEIGGLSECLTDVGDLRTLPTHLPSENPRHAGLDGFYAARLRRLR